MDVRSVPKSVLAVVAVYLALSLDAGAGFEGARKRLAKEWALLYGQGIIEAPVPPGLRGEE